MAINNIIDISYEGFFLCRLATDPDPSLEERGISGFTMAVAGESLLDPSVFFQPEDIEAEYGRKAEPYRLCSENYCDGHGQEQFAIRNIRQASPDYARYNNDGIGVKVSGVSIRGVENDVVSDRLKGAKVRFTAKGVPDHEHVGPVFEGRNQIVSDGDPDRFTVNPFVFHLEDREGNTILQRFDPISLEKPDAQLWTLDPEEYYQRFPRQRFPGSRELLDQIGVADAEQHFQDRIQWLKSKIAEALAVGKEALAEAYRTRLFGVEFFTKATGPTVLDNRLASRIPLRQLYIHPVRGTADMQPPIIADDSAFDPGDSLDLGGKLQIDRSVDWDALYYLGGYDGDLMTGFCSGTLSIPFRVV